MPLQDDSLDPLSNFRDEPLDTPETSASVDPLRVARSLDSPSAAGLPDVPPPSYSDSVYMDAHGGASSSAGSRSQWSEITPVEGGVVGPIAYPGGFVATWPSVAVSVHSPEKRLDAGASPLHRAVRGSYATFAVTWQKRHPGSGALLGGGATVRRRFRDFCALADGLHAVLPGAVLPVRPEKRLEGALGDGGSDSFLADRTRQLHDWTNALCCHPLASCSDLFAAFLNPDDDVWRRAATIAATVRPGGVSADAPGALTESHSSASPIALAGAASSPLLKVLRDLSASVTSTGGAAAGGSSAMSHPADADLLAAKASHAALVNALTTASAKAERYIGKCVSWCDALGDCGLAFVRLSRFEDAEAIRRGRFAASGAAQRLSSGDARAMGAACVRACRLGRAATAASANALQPLHTHQALIPAVETALNDRDAVLYAWQAAATDAANKRAIATRAQADPNSGPRTGVFGRGAPVALLDLHTAADKAEADEKSTRAALDTVSSRLQGEFGRLTTQRAVEFATMGMGFARVHVAAGGRAQALWSTLSEGVNSRNVEGGGSPGTDEEQRLRESGPA